MYKGGVPFIIEAAVAYGGGAGRGATGQRGEIMRFANRSPLLFDAGGCAITKAVRSVDWKRYEIRNFDEAPVTVLVNVVSAFVPYTGAGKQSISTEPEVVDEIKFAVMDVARDMQKYLSGKVRLARKEAKRKAISRYIRQLSVDLPLLANTGEPTDLEKKLTEIVLSKFKEEEMEEKKEAKTRKIMVEESEEAESDSEEKIEFDEEDM